MSRSNAIEDLLKSIGGEDSTVVRHYALNANSTSSVRNSESMEEVSCCFRLFAIVDSSIAKSTCITGGNIHGFEAAPTPATIAVNAVPNLLESAQFLDIDMDELAGTTVFITFGQRGRREVAQPSHTQAL